MPSPREIALNAINNNPQLQQFIASDPQKQELFEILKSGDAARGQQAANQLCQQQGITPEQGLQNAINFFSQQGQQ